jgi:RIO-like serine/threonine protein kinase
MPFVVKDYVLGGADSAINDAFGLEILEKLTEARVTQKAMRPVRVIERLDRDSFKLEYIPGRDVRKLADEAEDEEARAKLARLFERQLETLKNHLPKGRELQVGNYGFTVMEAAYRGSVTRGFQDLVVVLRRKEYPKDLVHLWIKPENVVVTPDGDFVIIDPR